MRREREKFQYVYTIEWVWIGGESDFAERDCTLYPAIYIYINQSYCALLFFFFQSINAFTHNVVVTTEKSGGEQFCANNFHTIYTIFMVPHVPTIFHFFTLLPDRYFHIHGVRYIKIHLCMQFWNRAFEERETNQSSRT
jgi:hypothetical protein